MGNIIFLTAMGALPKRGQEKGGGSVFLLPIYMKTGFK